MKIKIVNIINKDNRYRTYQERELLNYAAGFYDKNRLIVRDSQLQKIKKRKGLLDTTLVSEYKVFQKTFYKTSFLGRY